jgi:hypothetical protein
MREPLPPPRPDLLHQPGIVPQPGPVRGPRRLGPWLAGGAALVALVLIAVAGSVMIDRARTAETPSASGPTASATPSSPSASSTPSPASPLATLTVHRAGRLGAAPVAWVRWRASDGSFSFAYPPDTEPREPEFDEGLWELDSRGSAVHLYVYVLEDSPVDSNPMTYLEEIADGFTAGQTEIRRSRVLRHGLAGLHLEYLDVDFDTRFFIRFYAHEGLLYEIAAGYSEILDHRELRMQALTFLDSFRLPDGAVTGDS